MKRAATSLISAIIATGAAAFFSVPADAARCPQGYVYRPSKGVCQYRASYVKQTRVRYVKASVRHRVKRERPAKRSTVMRAKAAPAMPPPTPMWYFMEPNPFNQPYGRLVVILQNYDPKLAAWASMRFWGGED